MEGTYYILSPLSLEFGAVHDIINHLNAMYTSHVSVNLDIQWISSWRSCCRTLDIQDFEYLDISGCFDKFPTLVTILPDKRHLYVISMHLNLEAERSEDGIEH